MQLCFGVRIVIEEFFLQLSAKAATTAKAASLYPRLTEEASAQSVSEPRHSVKTTVGVKQQDKGVAMGERGIPLWWGDEA